MIAEPVLAVHEIQGNSLGGFNKDHQALIPVKFGTTLNPLRSWLATVSLTDLKEVTDFKTEMKRRLAAGQSVDNLHTVWVNLAFTWGGLCKLTKTAEEFKDPVFRSGLDGESSRAIGDSAIPGAPGERSTWVIGAPATVPDMLVIVGADRSYELDNSVRKHCAALTTAGCTLLKLDFGHDLSHYSTPELKYPSGREHFGFRDGISQPGVRGRLSDAPTDWLTARPASKPGPSTDFEFAQPGQVLVWPGEFVFGYEKQSSGAARLSIKGRKVGPPPSNASDPTAIVPWWGSNGSYLVFRRLYQDVAAFRAFAAEVATKAAVDLNKPLTDNVMAALLVGRWPSGAPVLLSPQENQQLGDDDNRNNDFDFSNDGDGKICPLAAHIRKVNPRNVGTDQGAPSRTLIRRILRRGIPYGPPLPPGARNDGRDRGLLFLSYQVEIQEQFMFLASSWANAANAPVAAVDQVVPGEPVGDGFDMIIGQAPGGDRERFCVIHDGVRRSRISTARSPTKDWVIATGGGFFFSPAISAVKQILAAS